MVCRIPESVGYLPMLSVRTEGLEPALFYWANDRRPREDVGGFESTELDRRYIVEVAKGQDHAWLRQMFPPSFIDWLASNTPVDFGFRLDNGVFTCECPQYRGQHRADGEVDEEHLDLLARSRGQGRQPDPRRGARGGGRQLGRDQPRLGRGARGARKPAARRSPDPHDHEVRRGHGHERPGLRRQARHGAQDRPPSSTPTTSACPCPAPPRTSSRARCPGTDRQGELAWLKFSSMVDMEKNYIAIVVDTGRDLPSAWIDAEDVTIPGFGEGISERALELAKAGTTESRRTATRPASTSRATPRGTGPAATRSKPSSLARSSSRTRWRERRRGHRAKLGPTARLRIVRSDAEELEVEATYAAGSAAPPNHFHPAQDEEFEILEGSMQVRIDGGPERTLSAGRDARRAARDAAHDVERRGRPRPHELDHPPGLEDRGLVPDPRLVQRRAEAARPLSRRSTPSPRGVRGRLPRYRAVASRLRSPRAAGRRRRRAAALGAPG